MPIRETTAPIRAPIYPPKKLTQSELLMLLGKLFPIINQSIANGSKKTEINEIPNIHQTFLGINLISTFL